MDDPPFIPPQETMVFQPTDEEWKEPLLYISSLQSAGEKYGIIKIKPPKWWVPPFSINSATFKFSTRIQRLNELECRNRVKLRFIDDVARFCLIHRGFKLEVPHVQDRLLDLHQLYKEVQHQTDPKGCCDWTEVAQAMSLKGHHTALKTHYAAILEPYHVYMTTKTEEKPEVKADDTTTTKTIITKTSRVTVQVNGESGSEPQSSAVGEIKEEPEGKLDTEGGRAARTSRGKLPAALSDGLMCASCNSGDRVEQMVLCSMCDKTWHYKCLRPPLQSLPPSGWTCSLCLVKTMPAPSNEFGFDQSPSEYTLKSFSIKANRFKSAHFGKPAHTVPYSTVEQEYWRLLSSLDHNITIEYGADVHAKDKGSGFPTETTADAVKNKYVNSPWNLNNLPILKQSMLRHISGEISGMKIPWCYVGMCFSSFCWHTEDHWTASINYNHCGEPKTWYGVPPSGAEALERVMKRRAPELFSQSADLLHHITTMISPSVLQANGVPVYRTDQKAGEFVVTYPRAYHGGFNQGLNFAEAVNFCPDYWLKYGRDSIQHYRQLSRPCVFSHDELVCRLAAEPDDVDVSLVSPLLTDLKQLVAKETELSSDIQSRGIRLACREVFEMLADDGRTCSLCKTTCFLSAITCECSPGKLVCGGCSSLCSCEPTKQCFRYRYTLDELNKLIDGLTVRSEHMASEVEWTASVEHLLSSEHKPTLEALLELSQTGAGFTVGGTHLLVKRTCDEAKRCSTVLQQLLAARQQAKLNPGKTTSRLSVNEVVAFLKQIQALKCTIPDTNQLEDLVDTVEKWQREVRKSLNAEYRESAQLFALHKQGVELDLNLPQVPLVLKAANQTSWLERVSALVSSPTQHSASEVDELVLEGSQLPPSPRLMRKHREIRQIQHDIKVMEKSIERALNLNLNTTITVEYLAELKDQCKDLPSGIKHYESLENNINITHTWLETYRCLLLNDWKQATNSQLHELLLQSRRLRVSNPERMAFNGVMETCAQWIHSLMRLYQVDDAKSLLQTLLSSCETVNQWIPCETGQTTIQEFSNHLNKLTQSVVEQRVNQLLQYRVSEMKKLRQLNSINTHQALQGSQDERRCCLCLQHDTKLSTSSIYHGTPLHMIRVYCQSCLPVDRPMLTSCEAVLEVKPPIPQAEVAILECVVQLAGQLQTRCEQLLPRLQSQAELQDEPQAGVQGDALYEAEQIVWEAEILPMRLRIVDQLVLKLKNFPRRSTEGGTKIDINEDNDTNKRQKLMHENGSSETSDSTAS